jgi:hypothetical protein
VNDPEGNVRLHDDAGGVWIRVGVAGGVLLYSGLVVMLAAGFTAILPFVVIPLVLVALIGANSLLGGPRRRQRPPGRPIRPADRGVVPASSGGPKVNGRSAQDGTSEGDSAAGPPPRAVGDPGARG